MKYFFETYGCQMNKAESAAIEQLFLDRGWQAAETAEDADIAIINTCSVRATAENRIFGRLGWYGALKAVRSGAKDAKTSHFPVAAQAYKEGRQTLTVIVTGCMAQRLLDTLKKDYPVVDYVVGNFQKQHFSEIMEAVEKNLSPINIDEEPVYTFAPVSLEPGAFTAFVPIMHGCNNFCTYCIVPYVRGREVSRNPQEILRELDQLTAHGVREITVLGQNVNSYRWESEGEIITFPRLMEMIACHLRETHSTIGWVRFMSSHPKDLSDELIDVISREKVLCHHIHLPVQHGSNEILRRMNRRYTRESYLSLIEKIRNKIPDVSLTTDILIGFPGETEEDFEKTRELMETVRYQAAYMYYYNPREGTPAATYENQVPVDVKKARLQKIIDMQLIITREETQKRLGKTVTVLVEAVSKDNPEELLGKTEQDERVVFAAPKSLVGTFVKVKLLELTGNTIRGIVEP